MRPGLHGLGIRLPRIAVWSLRENGRMWWRNRTIFFQAAAGVYEEELRARIGSQGSQVGTFLAWWWNEN